MHYYNGNILHVHAFVGGRFYNFGHSKFFFFKKEKHILLCDDTLKLKCVCLK